MDLEGLVEIGEYSKINNRFNRNLKFPINVSEDQYSHIVINDPKGIERGRLMGSKVRVPVDTERGRYFALIDEGDSVEFGTVGYFSKIPESDSKLFRDIGSSKKIRKVSVKSWAEDNSRHENKAFFLTKVKDLNQGGHLKSLTLLYGALNVFNETGDWDVEAVKEGLLGYLTPPDGKYELALKVAEKFGDEQTKELLKLDEGYRSLLYKNNINGEMSNKDQLIVGAVFYSVLTTIGVLSYFVGEFFRTWI